MGDLIYLEDDVDQYGDEPKPKARVMTISGDDAMALNEFMHHVNFRCYDERFKEHGMMKSLALRQHLDRVREILHTLLDYPQFEPFYYNCPARDLLREDAMPELQTATAERAEARFYSAAIYEAPNSIPRGVVEVAIDDATGEVCGIVRMSGQTTAATWTKVSTSLDDTIGIFVNAISFNEEDGVEPSA